MSGATVTVQQDGQMPSPIVLEVEFVDGGESLRTEWPVSVWFDGAKTFKAELAFAGREPSKITLDPDGRFPDRDPSDNVWEKQE